MYFICYDIRANSAYDGSSHEADTSHIHSSNDWDVEIPFLELIHFIDNFNRTFIDTNSVHKYLKTYGIAIVLMPSVASHN